MSRLDEAVRAHSASVGFYIDPHKELFDAPQQALVEVDLPEYTSSGLGRVLLRVMRYDVADLGVFALEGMSVGAQSSRGIVVYKDMNPTVVGTSFIEVSAKRPEVADALRKRGYPPALVAIGVLRSDSFGNFDHLVQMVDVYAARASWLESHPVEVKFVNLEVMAGGDGVDWERVLPNGPRLPANN